MAGGRIVGLLVPRHLIKRIFVSFVIFVVIEPRGRPEWDHHEGITDIPRLRISSKRVRRSCVGFSPVKGSPRAIYQLRFAVNREASRKIDIGVRRTKSIPSFMMRPGMTSGLSAFIAAMAARATSSTGT